jgi:RimJ/RimL family protein N-acetyltransferase
MPGAMFAAGDSVALHTVEEDDLEFLAAARNDPAVRRPLTLNRPANGEQIREFFENAVSEDDSATFLICVADQREVTGDVSSEGRSPSNRSSGRSPREDGDGGPASDQPEAVGSVVLFDEDDTAGTGTVAYWVAPENQSEGYCTEATGLLCEYAFAERRLNKLRADVLATNDASRHVLESLGFVEEGLLREEKYVYGEYVDVHRYGLLADDWAGTEVLA